MQLAVGNVLGAVFDGQNDENGNASNAQLSSCRILEGSFFILFYCLYTLRSFNTPFTMNFRSTSTTSFFKVE